MKAISKCGSQRRETTTLQIGVVCSGGSCAPVLSAAVKSVLVGITPLFPKQLDHKLRHNVQLRGIELEDLLDPCTIIDGYIECCLQESDLQSARVLISPCRGYEAAAMMGESYAWTNSLLKSFVSAWPVQDNSSVLLAHGLLRQVVPMPVTERLAGLVLELPKGTGIDPLIRERFMRGILGIPSVLVVGTPLRVLFAGRTQDVSSFTQLCIAHPTRYASGRLEVLPSNFNQAQILELQSNLEIDNSRFDLIVYHQDLKSSWKEILEQEARRRNVSLVPLSALKQLDEELEAVGE